MGGIESELNRGVFETIHRALDLDKIAQGCVVEIDPNPTHAPALTILLVANPGRVSKGVQQFGDVFTR